MWQPRIATGSEPDASGSRSLTVLQTGATLHVAISLGTGGTLAARPLRSWTLRRHLKPFNGDVHEPVKFSYDFVMTTPCTQPVRTTLTRHAVRSGPESRQHGSASEAEMTRLRPLTVFFQSTSAERCSPAKRRHSLRIAKVMRCFSGTDGDLRASRCVAGATQRTDSSGRAAHAKSALTPPAAQDSSSDSAAQPRVKRGARVGDRVVEGGVAWLLHHHR
jgi:hypothetical protein